MITTCPGQHASRKLGETYRATLLLGIILIGCSAVFGQVETATVSGVITDQSGGIVVGAEVRVTNSDTNVTSMGTSNQSGVYLVTNLKPGRYRIKVTKDGFKGIDLTDLILNVQDSVNRNFVLQVGSASESMTVEASALSLNTENAAVSTVIDRQFVENLPLNGRSFNTLLQLTPGVVIAPVNNAVSPGQFSIAGQRTDANNFIVDGVSANFGVTPSFSPGQSGTGTAQALSAVGGTSSLVSVEALQEFRVETSSFAPEFGRSPGGQIILTTRSGTNDFHGGIYEYFRNNVLDANDWFVNAAGKSRVPERHNDFGGFLGGPILKDKTFFFVSYEGARLRLPQALLIQVPSQWARTVNAPPALAPFLNGYPQPDDKTITPNVYTSQFTGAWSNSATLNAGSVRIDHRFNDRFAVFGRYNDAPSQIAQRVGALSSVEFSDVNTRTVTVGINMLLSSQFSNAVRGNYSTQDSTLTSSADTFGGAVPFSPALLLGSLPVSSNYLIFESSDPLSGFLEEGPIARNRTKQWNFLDDLSVAVGTHQLKFGGDYRALFLNTAPSKFAMQAFPDSFQSFSSSGNVFLFPTTSNPSKLLAQSFSLYGQDSWKIGPRFTLTYGLRWELSPPPSTRGTTTLAAWENVDNPSAIALAPSGTPVWNTTYGNVAPRIGVAYSLTRNGDFVLRAGGGIFYDLGVGSAANLATAFPNFTFSAFPSVSVPISDATPFLPSISLQPPFPDVVAVAPNLKLPRSYQWNAALEKSWGGHQAISLTYVGQAGRDLLRQEALFQPNANFSGLFNLTRNDARSNYNALQLQYRRPLSTRLQALLNYTWSHSLDNASDDVVTGASLTVISAAKDYASSSFDVRHSFAGAITYRVPTGAKSGPLALLTKDWSVDTVIVARSGFPFNAIVSSFFPLISGNSPSRPDIVPGQPFWISNPTAPGGKSLNPSAFSKPSTIRQGTEGRNDIPGFGLTQVDLSVGRKLLFSERLNLQFRADAFNVLNHPNFTNPVGDIDVNTSLHSRQMLNQGLGGLNPLFQEGGPRSLQLSLKFSF